MCSNYFWVLISVLSCSGLARLLEQAPASGEEVHLQGLWPMTAMIWTASNLEVHGRLFDVPLPVVVQLRRIHTVPVAPRPLLPQVITHPSTPCPGGVYRQDLGSFGELVVSLLVSLSYVSMFFMVFLMVFMVFMVFRFNPWVSWDDGFWKR